MVLPLGGRVQDSVVLLLLESLECYVLSVKLFIPITSWN